MKRFLALTFIQLFLLPNGFANGAGLSIEKKARGTAGVDEEYVKELKLKDPKSALERQEETRERMDDNPRNPAMFESFGGVGSKKDKQQREEQKKAPE